MKRTTVVAFTSSLLWLVLSTAMPNGGLAATITLNQGGDSDLRVIVRDTALGMDNPTLHLSPESVPFVDTGVISSGNAESRAAYQLLDSGFFISTFNSRPGSLNSHSTTEAYIFFSVDADTTYSMAGFIQADDPNSTGRSVGLFADLIDVGTSEVLFRNFQSTQFITDERFELGNAEGTVENQLSGSLDGILLAGHDYRVLFYTSIYANSSGDPAVANGEFSIRFSPADQSLPDVSHTLASLGLGLAVLLSCTRKTS